MSRLIKGSIDLLKIDKAFIIEGKNGAKYINVDVWVNDDKEPDQYGNNCGIKQSYKKGEEYANHFIGNGVTKLGFDAVTATPINPLDEETDTDNSLPF